MHPGVLSPGDEPLHNGHQERGGFPTPSDLCLTLETCHSTWPEIGTGLGGTSPLCSQPGYSPCEMFLSISYGLLHRPLLQLSCHIKSGKCYEGMDRKAEESWPSLNV